MVRHAIERSRIGARIGPEIWADRNVAACGRLDVGVSPDADEGREQVGPSKDDPRRPGGGHFTGSPGPVEINAAARGPTPAAPRPAPCLSGRDSETARV